MTADNAPVMRVRRLRPDAALPRRATEGSSGFDLVACIDQPITIGRDPVKVHTGISIEAPPGYDAQVRPRSGLSAKGVGVTFGTIDSDYRGEVLVTMYVFGSQPEYVVHNGDRIAQLVLTKLADLPVVETEELTSTERGAGGHGSTGR